MKKITNHVTLTLFLIIFVLNLIDLVLTYFVLPAEANPLILFTNNLWYFVFVKVLLVVWLGYYVFKNTFKTNFSYFMLLSLMVSMVVLLVFACISNVIGLTNEKVMSESTQMTTSEKVSGYTRIIMFFYILPWGLGMLSFKLYELSRKRTRGLPK